MYSPLIALLKAMFCLIAMFASVLLYTSDVGRTLDAIWWLVFAIYLKD